MGMFLGLLMVVAMFAVPIGGIILFVQLRAKSRRGALRGPWSELARQIGGQYVEGGGFEGSAVHVQRATHAITVKMRLVSVMDAVSVPYYPDGGTYTEVIVQLAPHLPGGFIPPGAPTQTFRDHTTIPSLAYLGPQAAIYLDTRVARVVLPGTCANVPYLVAAVQSLEHLMHLMANHGPLPVAA